MTVQRWTAPIAEPRENGGFIAYADYLALRTLLQDILAAGPIKEDEYPILLARVRAAVGGGV